MLQQPVIWACCAWEMPKLHSSRPASPMVLTGIHDDRTRIWGPLVESISAVVTIAGWCRAEYRISIGRIRSRTPASLVSSSARLAVIVASFSRWARDYGGDLSNAVTAGLHPPGAHPRGRNFPIL